MTVTGVIPFGADENKIKKALSSIVKASDELNATLYALRDYSDSVSPYECSKFCDFSSETKWSGGTFENGKTYIVGATECILKAEKSIPRCILRLKDKSNRQNPCSCRKR